ncbi:MAG: HAMP domain-containing histidine kinase [Anaerolineales bacterium]|nr:HAMP domain-containing histidine kinase [Anaerolineales bacterium]
MSANAELNETLLNAMFALNEAGDDLDEIYRIGLETAVTLLNADRGCIFQRDEWDDEKWTVVQTVNLNARHATSITTSTLLSEISSQQSNGILIKPKMIGYPLKIYKWTYWILYLEGENIQHNYENVASLFNTFFHQLTEYFQKANQTEVPRFLTSLQFEIRNLLSMIIGFAEALKEGLFGEMTEDQLEGVNRIRHYSVKLLDISNQSFAFTRQFDEIPFENVLVSDLMDLLNVKELIIEERNLTRNSTLHIDKFFFQDLINSLLSKATSCQVSTFNKKTDPFLEINIFYEDASAVSINLTYPNWFKIPTNIFTKGNIFPKAMKAFLNKMGGTLKMSAEAGKGYTLTITFPIVVENANE